MLVILNSARRSRTVVVTVDDGNADLLFRLVAHGVVEIQIVVGHNGFEVGLDADAKHDSVTMVGGCQLPTGCPFGP